LFTARETTQRRRQPLNGVSRAFSVDAPLGERDKAQVTSTDDARERKGTSSCRPSTQSISVVCFGMVDNPLSSSS